MQSKMSDRQTDEIPDSTDFHFLWNERSQCSEFLSDSLHRLHPRDLRGQAVRDLPALLWGLLWPQLLLQPVLRRTNGVSRPGLWDWRRSPDLDHRSEVPDGWDQRWRQPGQAAAHTRPVSFFHLFTSWCVLDPESFMQLSLWSYFCRASSSTSP